MKTANLFLLLTSAMFLFANCKIDQENQQELTNDQISLINSEIMTVTDNWGAANNAHDVNGSRAIWLNSKDFRLAENGNFFANYDSLSNYLDRAFAASDTLKFKWITREIFPLTQDLACFAATYEFSLKFKDGNKWGGTNALTATFIKGNSGWKVLNGQESTKSQ